MKWALIAGGSKGLGFSIAKALAKRRYNLLLIARNHQELNISRDQLQTQYDIQVEILACDLSVPESAISILEYCKDKGLALNILCNTAGLGGSGDFQDLSLDALRAMVKTNLEFPVALSFTLLPLLKQSSRSYILNIGSLAGFAPLPVKAVYASTKSALHSFSYSLRMLVSKYGISVTCASPGPLFTKPAIEKETLHQLGWFGKQMSVKPDRAAEVIVRAMLKGRMIVVPGKLAKCVSYVLRLAPAGFISRLLNTSKMKST